MSALYDTLRTDLKTAMKARDKDLTSVLRMLLAGIKEVETSGKGPTELDDEAILAVIAKQVKTRDGAADTYAEAGRDDLAEKERTEAELLRRYLPNPLTDEELDGVVAEALAEVSAAHGGTLTMGQMGQVIGAAKAKAGGRVEGGRLAAVVKAKITGA